MTPPSDQTVKGISAAASNVEHGGMIVVASRGAAGLPSEGEFRRILTEPRPIDELLCSFHNSPHTHHDQWRVQTLLQFLAQARIIVHSDLPASERAATRTGHTDDLHTTLCALRQRKGVSCVDLAIILTNGAADHAVSDP